MREEKHMDSAINDLVTLLKEGADLFGHLSLSFSISQIPDGMHPVFTADLLI